MAMVMSTVIPMAVKQNRDRALASPMNRLSHNKRSFTEWSIRVAIALIVLAVGLFGMLQSFANITRRSDPLRAYMMLANDGRITASAAEQYMQQKPSGRIESTPARFARLALQQDPTAVTAVVVLASQAQIRNDSSEARRLFNYAEHLSRRNLPAQLWAIEDAVSRGQVSKALRHYDIALRVSRNASKILYPVLASALSEPAIRSGLTVTLASKPIWGSSFIAYALGSTTDPRNIASLFNDMRESRVDVAPEASSSLIDRLLLISAPEDAWRYYTSLGSNIARNKSRDPYFANAISTSQFDWKITDRNDLSVSIQKDSRNGVVDYSVPTGNSGTILHQLQMLPPGKYRLTGSGSGLDQPDLSMPYWTLTCLAGGELGRINLIRSKQEVSTFSGRFTVPGNCPVQTLSFVARPTDSFTGIQGRINRVELTPDR